MIVKNGSLSVARPLIYDVSIQQNAENGKNKGGRERIHRQKCRLTPLGRTAPRREESVACFLRGGRVACRDQSTPTLPLSFLSKLFSRNSYAPTDVEVPEARVHLIKFLTKVLNHDLHVIKSHCFTGLNSIVLYLGSETGAHMLPFNFELGGGMGTHWRRLPESVWGVCCWLVVAFKLYLNKVFVTV